MTSEEAALGVRAGRVELAARIATWWLLVLAGLRDGPKTTRELASLAGLGEKSKRDHNFQAVVTEMHKRGAIRMVWQTKNRTGVAVYTWGIGNGLSHDASQGRQSDERREPLRPQPGDLSHAAA